MKQPEKQPKRAKLVGFIVYIAVSKSTSKNKHREMSCCTIESTIENEVISTMMDYERSLAIARKMDYHFLPGCCWANAVQALRLYHKQLGDVVYVEGWCAMPEIDLVQEHGWLTLADGTILDPTYAVPDDDRRVRLCYAYFPALQYKLKELKGVRLRSLPRVWKTGGFGGLQNEAYYAAMNAAYERIGRPMLERQPGRQERSRTR